MRLLFVSHSSPAKEGGAETRTREVAVRLARAGHEVTVLCGRTHVDDPAELDFEGVRILTRKTLPDALLRRFPYPHYLSLAAANLFLMLHLPAFLRKERFDLLREDIAPFPPTFLLALVKLPVRSRIAVTHMLPGSLRGWIRYYGALFGPAGYLMDRLLRAGVLRYDRIVCAAKWFAEELARSRAVAHKVRHVPNGVDFAAFSTGGASERGDGDVRLLCVGRLAETKGHRYAIEAVARLKDRHPRLRLDIVGSGALRGELAELARRLGVSPRVAILPPVAHREMPALYRRYDFFVMPSLWEGQPVSLIEAMASGLPIVATDIPAITAVLDERSATLAAKQSAADLAERLDWAIRNREAVRRRADTAREKARAFDWALTARQEIEEA
jgi:glycosyltransferase involved in cell wall biosynthesis